MKASNGIICAAKVFGPAAMVALLGACSQQGYSVIAATATTIGVSAGKDASGTGVETVLGYKRAEFAFVPTNRNGGEDANGSPKGGAKDSAEVLMEIRYGGTDSSSIYQRLAVGEKAVSQPGAAMLFIRNANGDVDPEAAQALSNILKIDTSESFEDGADSEPGENSGGNDGAGDGNR